MPDAAARAERILVAAPTARDAALTRSLLADAGLTATLCDSLDALVDEFARGAGALLLTEEAEASPAIGRLREALLAQPEWSEIGVILLAHPSRELDSPGRLAEAPGVTLLERPIRARTLVSALRMALRARRRQYQLQAELEAGRELQRRLEDELHGMHRLHAVGWRLAQLLPTGSQFEDVLDTARELAGADAAVLELANDDGTGFRLEAETGLPPAIADALRAAGSLLGADAQARREPIDHLLLERGGDACGPIDAAVADVLITAGFLRLRIAPMRSASGQPLGALVVAWRSSAAPGESAGLLLELLLQLVGGLLERTRREHERRDADRRKDEFLAMLAHELRNPLAPIRQAARVARAPSATPAQQRWSHDVIDRQVRHMALMLDDLLDLSRITRGTLVVRRVRVELKSVLEAAVETALPAIQQRQHALEVRHPAEPLWLDADPVRLAQVLSNLLNNAAKYTDAGGHLELVAEDHGEQVALRVRDDGIGLARDAVERVFEMFAQVDTSAERSDGGLGIGLALVRGLVALHGGTVTAHSEGHGRGSEFTVWLPLAARRAGARSGSVCVAPATAATPAQRILIADDNVDAAESLAMLLRMEGHAVEVVHDGAAAVATAREHAHDLVILDLGMPRVDGCTAAAAIRRLSLRPSPTLVALTGWGQDDDRRRTRDAGFDVHLTKPVDPDALLGVIRASVAAPHGALATQG